MDSASNRSAGIQPGSEVYGYYCATGDLDASQIRALLPLLSNAERERCDRLALPHDRRDYAAAHALLRLALAAHVHTAPERLALAADAFGKPFLSSDARDGVPPCFSLAHSRGLVACVVASGRAVGIDVEETVEAGATHIAEHFFSAEEASALERCSEAERPSRFCELWTLKEALLKAAGVGLTVPLHAVSFRVDGQRVTVIRTPPLAASDWAFVLRDINGTHKLAIAIGDLPGQPPRVRLMRIDPASVIRGVLAGSDGP